MIKSDQVFTMLLQNVSFENKQALVVLYCSSCGDVIGSSDRRKIF